jgi:hypothetical protein
MREAQTKIYGNYILIIVFTTTQMLCQANLVDNLSVGTVSGFCITLKIFISLC